MKPFMYLLFILFLLSAGGFSCKKSGNGLSIIGKWRIISDSTVFTGIAPHPSYHSNYIGTDGDYYDFRADGNMYVREGASLDTMAYEVLPGNQVRCVASPGFTTTYNTTTLTATHASFRISGFTSEGQLLKIIELGK